MRVRMRAVALSLSLSLSLPRSLCLSPSPSLSLCLSLFSLSLSLAAGKHFELKQYATWWQCVPRDEWPEEPKEVATILKDFEGEHGDHRQELVFIGVKMDKEAITRMLDECLLRDEEMVSYVQHWGT